MRGKNLSEENILQEKLFAQDVGAKIILARKDREYTQIQLAQLMKITFQQVQKYERGINNISVFRLSQISEILNLKICWFFMPLGDFKSRVRHSNLTETCHEEPEQMR